MSSPGASSNLFPRFVAQHTIRFDLDDPRQPADQFPDVVLPASLAQAVRKRKLEFLAGRFCVREALRSIAPALAETSVAIGPDRAPLWPSGIVGSICHTTGFASAAIARATDARAIGLDVELVMGAAQAESVLEHIASKEEVSTVAHASGWSLPAALTAIFSAKETIFKCLYASVGRYFDFRDVELEAFDVRAGTFRARLITTLAPTLPAGEVLIGTFSADAAAVWTAIVLPP